MKNENRWGDAEIHGSKVGKLAIYQFSKSSYNG